MAFFLDSKKRRAADENVGRKREAREEEKLMEALDKCGMGELALLLEERNQLTDAREVFDALQEGIDNEIRCPGKQCFCDLAFLLKNGPDGEDLQREVLRGYVSTTEKLRAQKRASIPQIRKARRVGGSLQRIREQLGISEEDEEESDQEASDEENDGSSESEEDFSEDTDPHANIQLIPGSRTKEKSTVLAIPQSLKRNR